MLSAGPFARSHPGTPTPHLDVLHRCVNWPAWKCSSRAAGHHFQTPQPPPLPQDPLFWMIHTIIERMLSAKRLPTVTKMGTKVRPVWPLSGPYLAPI